MMPAFWHWFVVIGTIAVRHLVHLAGQLVGETGPTGQGRRGPRRPQVGRRSRGVEQARPEVVAVPLLHHVFWASAT